jgi:FkbM family methyltransferase
MNFLKKLFWIPVKSFINIVSPSYLNKFKLSALNFLINFGYSNSLNRMDKQITNFFNNMKSGKFLEIGAADGIDQSNSFLLEKKYGWSGYLVEPVKNQYLSCKKYRKNSLVKRLIITSPKIHDQCKTLPIKVNSLRSQILSNTSRSDEVLEEMVETTTLNHFFKDNNISNIDIFSLDVEGYEYEVLDGYNDNSNIIRYLLVETWDISKFMIYAEDRKWKFIKHFGNNDYLFQLHI